MARGIFAVLHACLSHNIGKGSLRRRLTSKCKGDKGSYHSDRISLLPDEILISILSLLPLEDAARTCILSRRWKSLGVSYHRNLVFDGTPAKGKRVKNKKKMVKWVYQVLESHRGSTIDGFCIRFNFKKSNSRGHLIRWLQLLSSKLNGIKSFELEFSPFTGHQRVGENMPLPSLPLAPFRSLTSLSLRSLKGSKDFVQGILNNCLHLENLCVANLEGPAHLKVPGSLLQLKYLEIVQWKSLEKVEVYALNLSKFKYYGDRIDLFFDMVPQLTNVSIGSKRDHLGFAVDPLSGCFAHLKTLSLQPKFPVSEPLWEQPPNFPPTPTLNHLELHMTTSTDTHLLNWASFVVRLPALQTLKVTFCWYLENGFNAARPKPPNHCCSLKTLEIFGFQGDRIDLDFALYLVENAVELEKLVIEVPKSDLEQRARCHARFLGKFLREGAIFELL